MNRWASRLLCGVLFGVVGCADDTAVDASAPASHATESPISPTEDAAEAAGLDERDEQNSSEASFDVIVGTGRDTHVPIDEGDTVYLELGHQGLQHVLVSLRLIGLEQARYVVDFTLIRDDGVSVSEPSRVRLPFSALPDGSGVELLGYTLVVADPALGVGHDAVLRVAVDGPDGEVATDERRVHVEWAPEGWDPDA